MASLLGVIGGSSFLKSDFFRQLPESVVDTPFGGVRIRRDPQQRLIFVQRHMSDPVKPYLPPHLINHRAIVHALQQEGCTKVVGFGSTGSLKPELPIGSLLIADDFFSPANILSFFDDYRGHCSPGMDESLRQEIIKALSPKFSSSLVTSGTYCQASGPRFETKAEIRHLASVGDVVGMTCAHEATLCREIKLPYALICAVDNFANGVSPDDKESILEQFKAGNKTNLGHIQQVAASVLNALAGVEIEALQKVDERTSVDLIVNAHYVVPVDSDKVLENHAVVVQDAKIVAILPQSEAKLRYNATQTRNLRKHALMPGLVNAHTHCGMTLLRGFADDMALLDWLHNKIWPAEAKFVAPDFVRSSSQLAIAEAIRCGTTCLNDMYFFPESVAKVVDESGFRGVIGAAVIDFPNQYASGADECLSKGETLAQQYEGHERVTVSVAPHAPYTVCDANLKRCHEIATERQVPFHIHLHETKDEVEQSELGATDKNGCHRSEFKLRPLANMERLGIVDQNFVAVHMTQVTPDEAKLLGQRKANVVHCPTSNLKLASGFCPVDLLLKNGVNVALGTDSSASNNCLDMLAELKLAAILAKAVSSDATAVPALTALRMATINGAKALGLGHVTGSLTVGKFADMAAIELDRLELLPLFDVLSHIVYAATHASVSDVWVAGRELMRDRKLTTLDEAQIVRDCEAWGQKLAAYQNES